MTEQTTAEVVCVTSSGWSGSCIDVGRPSMFLWCRGCLAKLEQAEAQRDEAVGRFILAVNEEAEADMKRGNPLEGAHHRALEKLGSPFLTSERKQRENALTCQEQPPRSRH